MRPLLLAAGRAILNPKGGGSLTWTVYILRCGDGSLYTGCTNDLPRRLAAHRSGRGAKYTRSRPPVELVYTEEVPDKSAALRREIAIKRLPRAKKLALIAEKGDSVHGQSQEGGSSDAIETGTFLG